MLLGIKWYQFVRNDDVRNRELHARNDDDDQAVLQPLQCAVFLCLLLTIVIVIQQQ